MVDATDIIEKDDIRSIAENVEKQNMVWRQAFRGHDGSSAGGKMTFPELKDGALDLADDVEVPEGAEYPVADFQYDENVLVYSKYGVGIKVSDEAVEDSVVDVILDGNKELMRVESRRMDSIAYSVVQAAASDSGIGDADDKLTFEEIIRARAWHTSDAGGNYHPDMCFVEPQGSADLLIEEKDRHTQQGDEAARNGEITRVAGMSVVETDTGSLPAHDAILVDSGTFGWESTKRQKEVEQERRAMSDETLYKISDRLGWIATTGAAAAYVEG